MQNALPPRFGSALRFAPHNTLNQIVMRREQSPFHAAFDRALRAAHSAQAGDRKSLRRRYWSRLSRSAAQDCASTRAS
ncbi:Uncharacterised protein [Vibrio cholerae]|nr:Uncharacterised protein [Vibrio cholerae]CSI00625.1 Uncharacterised protein [Vibrio cholerae]